MNNIAPRRAISKAITWLTILTILQPYGLAATAAPAPAAATKDIGWPRQVSKNGAELIYYQPQIDEWKDYKELSGRAAFSLTLKGGKETLGVVSFQADTIVDKEARTAYVRDIEIVESRFPSLDAQAAEPVKRVLKSVFPAGGETISIDRVMADLEQTKAPPTQTVQLKNDPPQIFHSVTPALLLMVQGDPVLAPIQKTNLEFVVNTNWDLFFDKAKKHYYVLADNSWLTAEDLKGPWTQTQALPKEMAKLPAGQNFDDVKKFVPPPPPSGTVPKVFFSSTPAELILFRGAPVYTKISGTQLLYASNTDNDFFVNDAEKQYYVLLSGRWFRGQGLEGPWSYAGNDLPAEFSKIPSSSPRARVLASVPGTIEATDAVMLAQIPTTAIINRAQAEAQAKVTYDGAPQFKPIESTPLQYATNTQDKVIKEGDLYYLCFQGVWFVSKNANGPWKTADAVPKEIYTIPPSSPVYNVTYVTQTNPTPNTVESSHTAGYLGMFVVGLAIGARISYGTGYYYPPYVYWGRGLAYPVYRPWPMTYGVGAVYNPWTGGYAVGRRAYGPYGAAGSSAWYNPANGRYGRSASVQGWYGGRTAASAYNPWTGGYAHTNQGHNAYSQWGSSVATRGDQWARTGHVTTARGTTAAYNTSTGQHGVIHTGANGVIAKGNNNVYAGHDGNVYRKDSNGNWSQYTKGGGWNSLDTSQAKQQASQARQQASQNLQQRGTTQAVSPSSLSSRSESRTPNLSSSTMEGLNSSAQSRQRGQTQTQRFQNRGGGGFRGRRR